MFVNESAMQGKVNTPSSQQNRSGNVSYPSRTIIHPKLELTEPGDSDEQEADAAASDVMSGKVCRKISGGGAGGGMAVSSQMESQLNHLQGGGQAMPSGLRGMMERGFDRDFSQVRLHTDSEAAGLSSSIHAKAFTHGNDIYFNRGQFSPETSEGQRLVAHELAHVAQGGGKVGRKNEFYNGADEKDLRFLEAMKRKLLLSYIEGGRNNRFLRTMILNLNKEIKTDRSVNSSDFQEMIKALKEIEYSEDIHYILAHGNRESIRFSGRKIRNTKEFKQVFPLIKDGDIIVMLNCYAGADFAIKVSKEYPKSLVIASTGILRTKTENGNKFVPIEGELIAYQDGKTRFKIQSILSTYEYGYTNNFILPAIMDSLLSLPKVDIPDDWPKVEEIPHQSPYYMIK